MSNYDEALEDEKKALSRLLEDDFYEKPVRPADQSLPPEVAEILALAKNDPALMAQMVAALLNN